MVAASLWVLGFNVPLLVVRPAFKHQIVGYYRRVGANLDDLADRIWDVAERFTRTDARIRRGSITDQEGEALQQLMREVLLLLFGVGDDTGEDIAEELIAQINILKPIAMKRSPGNIVPDLHDNDIKYLDEGIYWIRNFAAIARQGEAIASARHHDWVKARRIARLAIGTFARADAALAPQRNVVARALFARTAATFAYALFPILLAVTQDDEERRKIIKTLFSFAVQVRRRAPGAARRERIDAFAGCRPRKSKDSLHLPHDRLETDSDEV